MSGPHRRRFSISQLFRDRRPNLADVIVQPAHNPPTLPYRGFDGHNLIEGMDCFQQYHKRSKPPSPSRAIGFPQAALHAAGYNAIRFTVSMIFGRSC